MERRSVFIRLSLLGDNVFAGCPLTAHLCFLEQKGQFHLTSEAACSLGGLQCSVDHFGFGICSLPLSSYKIFFLIAQECYRS